MQKLIDFFNQWGLLLGAVAAAWAAAVRLLGSLGLWFAGLFVFTVGAGVLFFYWRSRNARASWLKDPDALKLAPQSPEQLAGRGEDLRRLLNAASNSIVFLVSESGCGKSALLSAGVAQDPAFAVRFLPIYIDMSALDWERAPLQAVREGFSGALPADDPARNSIKASSEPVSYLRAFSSYYKRTGRRPLLLLDQFDDYQADPRHRDRFIPAATRIWRQAADIAPENKFWRVLDLCLENNAASIIVACRDDAAKGLESIRFHPEVPIFDLPRLEAGLVRKIIDRLTKWPSEEVIANPEGGWTVLRNRLADDLEARGHVLPQQLKVVLGGLRTLHRLTPAYYNRVGRVAGLEAASISGALSRAARVAGLSDDDAILKMVVALVDRARQPPDKGPPIITRGLAEIAELSVDIAERALSQLERDEIIRKHSNADVGVTAWQLDHAYLASPTLAIERERNKWHLLLVERARSYAEATWQNKWAALLPVYLQAQLLAARLKTPFRYGQHRWYALVSLVRVLPAFAIVGLVAGLIWFDYEFDAGGRIENKLAVFDDEWSGRVSTDAANGLSELAGSGWVTRWRVASDLLILHRRLERCLGTRTKFCVPLSDLIDHA